MAFDQVAGSDDAAPAVARVPVAVYGSSSLARRVTAAIVAQPDMEVAPASMSGVQVLVDGDRASDSLPTVRVGRAQAPVHHSAWGLSLGATDHARARLTLSVPDAPMSAILRPLRSVPEVTDVHVVRLAPGDSAGPIDAIVPDMLEQLPPPWPPDASWSVQTAAAPQTRCWLVACFFRTRRPVDRGGLLTALAGTPRVLLVSRSAGFADTGVLCEFFRDIGRPAGDFFETVIFADSVRVDVSSARFWLAAEAGACVAEAVDALRMLCRPDVASADSAAITDRALGLAAAAAALGGPR